MSLLDSLSKTAARAVSSASCKADEMREINKLKDEQNKLKTQYSNTKKKLAELVFKRYQDGELQDEAAKEFCEKMQEIRDQIDGIDDRIDEVIDEYEAKVAERNEERI